MASKNTSILSQELEPLNAQIKQIWRQNEELEAELRSVEARFEAFSTDNQRFEALRDVCNALDKLGELDAAELFWNEMPGSNDGAGHVERLRNRIIQYEAEIQSNLEEQNSLKVQINHCLDEVDALQKQVNGAYIREQLRQEEFVVEREVSPTPFRPTIMPWANDTESESLFRRSLLIALLLTFIFGSIIPLIDVPVPDPMDVVKVPERLAMLLKKEPPKPEPIPEKPKEEKKPEEDPEKPKKTEDKKKPKPTTEKTKSARKKAETTGVLAFKSSFADLMDETPVAKLGSSARLSKTSSRAAGAARGQRSLVAMATGSSGGIGSGAVSRNVGSGGSDRIGGVGFARVASSLTGMEEEAGRPVSDGPGPARTDEEIQIIFDKYKALLYRIYNKELRKNPTLRGKILLRITIEPDGTVSECKVESTDLASPKLVGLIVGRVKKFNFGPKDDVPKTTILYPIDFLPAG
ncbi:MAG: AgmX/PglI C-terminal domain-containing protein [Thermodesulfobacteriota bacterium]